MEDFGLSPVELQTPRSAEEFYSWVNERIEKIGASAEGKRAVRFRRNLCKPLVEELLPLGLLCKCFFQFDPRVTITPVLGNQNFDATVQDQRSPPSKFSKIEITQAHEGENDFLRMLYLEREGHTNLLGRVEKSGTKQTGISVSVASEAQSHNHVLADKIKLVSNALDRKLAKEYDMDTALLVVFDDMIAIQSDRDCEAVTHFLRGNREKLLAKFGWVGVIGWGERCFTYIN